MRTLTCGFYASLALVVVNLLFMYGLTLLQGGAWYVMLPSLWLSLALGVKYYFKIQQLRQSLAKEEKRENEQR